MIKKVLFVLTAMAVFSSVYAADGNPAAGKEKSTTCAACHGPDGNSPSPDFPRLAGQNQDYLAASLYQYKTGKRKNPIMAGFAANLSDQDIADLTAYFSSQSGLKIKY